MTDWNTIDDYLANRLPADERIRFEATLRTDPALAEGVAFYITARQTLRQQGQTQRRTELLARTPSLSRAIPWSYAIAAAACVLLLLGIGWLLQRPQQPTSTQVADAYIDQQFTELSVTMGATSDSLQQGLALVNGGKLMEADRLLTDLSQRQPANAEVQKWVGVVSLRRGNYDKAISQFQVLSRRTDLFANPGLFLEALTRIKRNRPNDKVMAKILLQTVVNQNLEGAVAARALLESM